MALHCLLWVLEQKVLYSVLTIQIIIAGVINGHVAFKYVYIRIFRGTDRMHKRDLVAVGTWIGIGLLLWIIAWIIASAIPVFSNLLSLIVCPLHHIFFENDANLVQTALFASWFTYGLSGIFWLFMNKGLYFSSPRKIAMTILNLNIVGIGAVLVCPFITFHYHLTNITSVVLVSTSPEKPSTIIPAAPVSPAPLIISFFCFLFSAFRSSMTSKPKS